MAVESRRAAATAAGETAFASGPWVAVIGSRSITLLDPQTGPQTVEELWQLTQDDAPLEDLLDAVAAVGLRRLPSFAIVQVSGQSARAVVRGAVSISGTDLEGSCTQVSGSDVVSWTEHAFDQLLSVSMEIVGDGPREEADQRWRVSSGVVGARKVSRALGVAALPGSAGRPPTRSTTEAPPAAEPPLVSPSPAPGPVPVPEVVNAAEPPREEPPAFPLDEPPPGAQDSYDFLFGATVQRTVEDAAVRDQTAGDNEPAREAHLPVSELPPESPTAVPLGDHDGMTITSEDLRNLLHQAEGNTLTEPVLEGEWDRTSVKVLAVSCPAGHLNPPQSTNCRVCQQKIQDQEALSVSRPPVGTLRLSTGEAILLDRPVLIGRAPEVARVTGPELPHLVSVPSPDHEISRNHVEVRLEGWHVLVADLNSTNGTTVTLPGAPPQRLHPGEATLIIPGTTVSLSDAVSFSLEVHP